jgi:hypothetical protein
VVTDLLVRPGTRLIYNGRVYEVLETSSDGERRLVLEHRKQAPADPLPEARRLEEGMVIHVWPTFNPDGGDMHPADLSARITDIVDEGRYVRAYYYLTGTVERKGGDAN